MYSRFSSSVSVDANILENPTIAFNGVRISWLMLARKADFNRLDSSAYSFASRKASSICFRVVITTEDPTKDKGFPFLSH